MAEQRVSSINTLLEGLGSESEKIGGQSQQISQQFDKAIQALKSTILDDKITQSVLLNSTMATADLTATYEN